MAETNNREDVRTSTASENGLVLPWGQPPERQTTAAASDVTPGEFVLRHLFKDFTDLAEKKIETILTEPLERPLSKSLQRGEDAQFDQLLNSLNSVAEFSLPSLLKTLFKWYEKQQIKTGELETDGHKGKANISKPKGGSESPKLQSKFYIGKDHLTERRDLAVDFLFCLVLIEVLKQLPVHPVDDGYVQYILSLAFRHFKQRDSYSASPTAANGEIIAALYAEVLGVLAQACFLSVKKRFVAEFKEYQNNPSVFVNIIYGMKYLRIKLYPVEELEESFNFMRDCATLFVDSRDKEVKHAFASMFVEILLPVAAGANRELNVPALKSFVDTMYHHTFDLTKKTRHSQAIYPLVTVLLCVSQKAFFLSSWPSFLSMCLGTLKQRDVKMQKVAMECLYRLVWVYMIRIKGESNTATVSRLRSITDVLFPRGSRGVVPREAPMNYFVKIIQFIAQEKLDFAMNDIVFDLLSVNRTGRAISPERMNIGLRAFFVIADSLQRKGIEAPAMPTSTAPFPSGSTVRVRRVASMKNLTESQASSIGLANYYHGIRKALDSIIRSLDAQIGRPLMMTNPHCSHKEPEDIATGERKPKVDPKVELFRTCIAAIPRCIPEGMTKLDLVDLLSRLTVHMDEELRGLALSSLQSLLLDFADWRETTILGYINFILREIQDNLPSLLDSALRMLLQLLAHWKTVVSAGPEDSKSTQDAQLELSAHSLPCDKEVDRITVLHNVEGFALVMLCSIHPIIRRLAFLVLKEVRTLSSLMDLTDKEKSDKLVLDVIDQVFPTVLEKVLHSIPQSEKLFTGPIGNVDIMVVNERLSGNMDKETGEQLNISLHSFFWSSLMAGLLNKWYLPELSPSALQFCWPNVFSRLLTVYSLIDSGASGIDSITSLSSVYSRGPKKTMNTSHVCLFRNYLIFACCAYPRSLPLRSDSSEHDGGTSSEGSETRGDSRPPSPNMVDSLFRFAVPLLKSDCSDIREAVIVGLGRTSPSSFRELLEELLFLLREALDRRAEGVRRRRKRDVLRAYLVRIFELNAEHGCFQDSASELVTEDGLSATFIDYIDGTRLYLESESDKDMPAIMQLRLHFANFIYKMITSVPASLRRNLLPDDMRCNLFFLFSSWCAHFGVKGLGLEKTPLISSAQSNDLELASLHAMCGLLQCGPAFDPNGLSTGGYLYNWLQTVLNSPKERIHQLGHDTLVSLLENNANIPSLLYWVIDKCYMGARLVVNGCFKALVSVFTKSEYPCEMIPTLNVVLYKTADSLLDIREKAAQLLQLLERRFFPFTTPSLSCAFRCSYSQCQRTLSQALATAHPEITIHMFEEMTARFEMTSSIGQRCILQYMLPWLANVELVDLSNSFPTPPELNIETEEEEEETDAMSPVKLEGEGWGSVEATQLVLNNLFYITVKYDEIFSKEIEEAWGSLCSRWENNIHEILGYLIALAGIIGSSEVLIHAKKLAVYVARARKQKTVEELMEELKLTETVASQFERCDDAPFFRPLQKTSSSRDSVIEGSTGEESRSLAREETTSQAKVTKEETKTDDELSRRTSRDERKESREERREGKDDKKEKGDSLPRTLENDALDSAVPLAEPEEVDQIEEEDKPEGAWAQEWMIMAHRLVNSGLTLSLPVPEGEKFFAPLPDILPRAPSVASLYRCNFALTLLAELVLDQASVDWEEHLPLMLHVIFLALDHGKALVYEHSKRLLVNLIIVLVCRGDHVSLAQSLFNFITVSEQGLGKHGLLKSSWTLDVGNFVGVPGPGAGAGTGAECDRQGGSSVQSNAASAGTSLSESAAGGSSLNIALPPEENSANRLVEQIQELIEFLANSDCKPLWAFEEITPRSYKIKSAEQLELFVASVVQIFQASDSGSKVQEAMAKVALQWATSCSSRHYAGRSFQVFRALKVPLSWSMLSDVLSRLVESVGDGSEDVQGYVMEILLTLETASDWAITDHPNRSGLEQGLGFHFEDEKEDSIDEYNLHIISASVGSISPLTRMRHGGHIRSLSSGCEFKRHSSLFSQFGRLNGNRDDPNLIRTRSVSVQCLKTPSEAINPQSQADMVTRVFWIAVSLLESDYEHEFLMAIHLLNKVLSILDLSLHDSRDKLDKVLHRLKWNDFPGLQALLLKGLTNAATSEPSLHLLAKLTVFSNVGLVDPSQAAGFALNMLALLPHMLEHFDDPDEFSKTCAQNIVQVCGNSGNLAHLGKLFEMYIGKSYHRPRSTWLDAVYRYINDSYGHLTRSHVTFLLEVLERGPPAYNQVVLGMLCSVMRLADFSSPSMRHFQNDALKTIAKYLKGNFWKESLDILKMAVSHSSHLDTPPPRPASSVWTAYDSSWSTEAMMIKKDLPGRTLDFTFDLSATPVIGRRSTPEPQVDSGKENKLISPVATVDMSVWRKPHLSQRRTRERLVNVLTTCGHTVGLKQSPSVVFSSSSDLAVEKQGAGQQPSSEEASLAEGLTNETAKDELEPQQISVLTNFDFLYDDEAEDVMWGPDYEDRRLSYCSMDTGSLDRDLKSNLQTLECLSGSEQDLTPHDSSDDEDELSRSIVSSTLTAVTDNSTVIEGSSESSSNVTVVVIDSDSKTPEPGTHSRSPSVESSDSLPGASETSYSYKLFAVTEITWDSREEPEKLWTSHVGSIVKDNLGVTAVNTFSMFCCLYKSTRRKFYSLTRECCNYLVEDKFRDVTHHFSNCLEFLESRGDCPFVFIDTETLNRTKLLERHKFAVLELHSHFSSYMQKSERTLECLDDVKLAVKRSSVGSHHEEPETRLSPDPDSQEARQVQLCRYLYKTHFQFLLFCSTYARLLESLVQAARQAEVNDLTQEVTEIRREVSSVLEHPLTEDTTFVKNYLNTEPLTRDSAVQVLVEKLCSKDLDRSIHLLRTFREKFGGEVFGISDEDNLDSLVSFYCKHVAEKNVGSLVMSGPIQNFAALCRNLMEVNVAILAAVEDLNI